MVSTSFCAARPEKLKVPRSLVRVTWGTPPLGVVMHQERVAAEVEERFHRARFIHRAHAEDHVGPLGGEVDLRWSPPAAGATCH